MPTLSIRKWATAHGVPIRTAYYWAEHGHIPVVKKKVTVIHVDEETPPPVKSK